MEHFIRRNFNLSPFLDEFFTVLGLYNREAIVSLKDPAFLSKVNEYFKINIQKFKHIEDVAGQNIMENMKPGDAAQLNAIIEKVTNLKGKKFLAKRNFKGNTRREQTIK